MFTRLKETYRILAYREPNGGQHVPDVQFVEQENPTYTKARLKVAKLVQVAAVVYFFGIVSTPIADAIEHLLKGHRSPSATTVAGGLGALLVFAGHFLREQIEGAIKKKISVEQHLAPFFGRRVENAIRTLKGIPRAV